MTGHPSQYMYSWLCIVYSIWYGWQNLMSSPNAQMNDPLVVSTQTLQLPQSVTNSWSLLSFNVIPSHRMEVTHWCTQCNLKNVSFLKTSQTYNGELTPSRTSYRPIGELNSPSPLPLLPIVLTHSPFCSLRFWIDLESRQLTIYICGIQIIFTCNCCYSSDVPELSISIAFPTHISRVF